MSPPRTTGADRSTEAVIFDLDGTLTVPDLDFDEIRREIGAIQGPILEAIQEMPRDARERAMEILERREAFAAARARLRPFATEVLETLARRRVPTAVLTRNSRRSLDRVLNDHGLSVDARRSREDGAVKPSPEPVLALCAQLGVAVERTFVVGDYIFDLQSARAAGATAVLLLPDGEEGHEDEADIVVGDLRAVLALVADTATEDGVSS